MNIAAPPAELGDPAEAPDPPPAAQTLFGERLPLVRRYAGLLAGPAVERGLLGPREVPRLWQRHLLNCAVVAELLPAGAQVCDVGSGAGLPGVVVAAQRPDVQVTLLEPLLRRASFLTQVVAALPLPNAAVERGRAEEQPSGGYDVVLARAVAPLDRLARLTLPLLRRGGRLLAFKGVRAQDEIEAGGEAISAAGATDMRLLELGAALPDGPVRVVEVTSGGLGGTTGAAR